MLRVTNLYVDAVPSLFLGARHLPRGCARTQIAVTHAPVCTVSDRCVHLSGTTMHTAFKTGKQARFKRPPSLHFEEMTSYKFNFARQLR